MAVTLLCEHLDKVPASDSPLVLAIGTFDGFHIGHQQVIQTAARHAKLENARLGVLRFHPHPSRVLRPETAPSLLFTESQAQAVLEELNVDLHLRLPFTPAIAALEPEEFLKHLHQSLPGLIRVVVGPNWRFGRMGRGDIELLQHFATTHGFHVDIAPGTAWGDELVSSTRIREAISLGMMDLARSLLGRPYPLTGIIREGKQLGRQLGFPTANFTPDQELIPSPGVYAMQAHLGGRVLPGAGYLTRSPRLAEVHLLDFSGDLYGLPIQVDLIHFLRSAQPIKDTETLKAVIARDVATIREMLVPAP
jgi:riboflavin kinase / FMN adenylyltransferase